MKIRKIKTRVEQPYGWGGESGRIGVRQLEKPRPKILCPASPYFILFHIIIESQIFRKGPSSVPNITRFTQITQTLLPQAKSHIQ